MKFSGLKITIAGVLLAILATAFILSNVVTIVFWQKSLKKSLEEKATIIVSSVEQRILGMKKQGRRVSGRELQEIANEFAPLSLNVSYYDGVHADSAYSGTDVAKVEQVVRMAGLTQKEKRVVQGSTWGIITFGGTQLILARPIEGVAIKNGAIAVALNLESIYGEIKKDLKIISVYLLVNLLILFVIGFFRMVKLVIKPIERMVKVSETYQLSDGITFSGDGVGSEFGQLSMALNSMLLRIEMDREQLRKTVASLEQSNRELVETQKEMVLAEKHAAVGRLAAGLAHEIGNPLGIVQGYIELLQNNDLKPDEQEQFSKRALAELERINRLIRELLDFSRSDPEKISRFSMLSMVHDVVEMFRTQNHRIVFEVMPGFDDGAEYGIKGDQDGIRQVLVNCILNAIDSIEARFKDGVQGAIQVDVKVSGSFTGEMMVETAITDNGMGIDGEISETVFEPFFSTKEAGKGTGLGLSVSHSIVDANEGKIWIENSVSGGATVYIAFPQDKHGLN